MAVQRRPCHAIGMTRDTAAATVSRRVVYRV
jgi:hypothetical protein